MVFASFFLCLCLCFGLWVAPLSMGGSVKDVHSKKELNSAVLSGVPVILHFWASWCEASKHMDEVFAHLSTDFPHAHFLRVEAEEQPQISEPYSVSAVPYFAFVKDVSLSDWRRTRI
ncbi:unnamed protein product [Prunus armeniaca]